MIDLKTVIEIITKIDTKVIVYSGFIIFFIWAYKEFRTHLLENEKDNLVRINTSLEIYGKLIININNHLKESKKLELDDTLYKSFPYLPKKIIEYTYDLNSKENLSKLLELLKEEVKNIKSLQYDIVSSSDDFDYFGFIYQSCKKMKLGSFIIPLITIFMILYTISFFVRLGLYIQKVGFVKECSMIFGFSSIILKLFIVVPMLIQYILDKKFIHNATNWLLILFLLIVPSIFIKTAFMGIVDFICLLIYIFIYFFGEKRFLSIKYSKVPV